MHEDYTEGDTKTASVKTFKVYDGEGNPVAVHHRKDLAGGGKKMWLTGPDGRTNLSDLGVRVEQLPLYNSEYADGWDEDNIVVVVEGEKAADALMDTGHFNCLGTLGTGHRPNADRLEVLRDREVVLWPDNDDPGRQHMARLAGDLRGIAAAVRIYEWQDAPLKGDAADHPAVRDGDAEGLDLLLNELMCAPEWEPEAGVNTVNAVNTVPKKLPAPAPFPVDALPRACRRLVEEAAAAIGCPPDFVALPMLVALGAAIGNSRALQVKRGWIEGAVLYGAVVSEPGEAKTPAAGIAAEPARRRQAKLRAAYRSKREEHEAKMRQFEKDRRDCRSNGVADPVPPEEPVMERVVVDDTTVEGLVRVLDGSPRGVLVDKDELAAWVNGMDQYRAGGRGADRQFWLSAWSGKPLTVDRRSHPEPVILTRPFVGVFGTIQPGVLPTLGHDREDGMLDRFLFAYPEPSPSRWSDDEISDEATASVAGLFDRLHDLDMPLDENGDPDPKRVRFSPDAKDVFAEVVDAMGEERERPGFPARLKGPWAKLVAYLARLSLILAMCRAVEDGAPERVEAGDVLAAVILLDYLKNHARRVYAKLYGHDPEDRLAEEVAGFLAGENHSWTGTATGLYEALKGRGCRSLPADPDRLTGTLQRVAERYPALGIERGRRRVGGKVQRCLTLSLETGVHSVHGVHAGRGEAA